MAPTSVSTLVLNIYRGILNVLQLKIKQTHNFYELQEVCGTSSGKYYKCWWRQAQRDFSGQAGAQGVCKTTYAIYEEEKAERVHVTKTRDLNHCQEGVIKDMGLAYTQRCAKCQQVSTDLLYITHVYIKYKIIQLWPWQDAKSLRGSTAYDYVFKSHADGVQILQVTANELIQFAPLGEMNGAVQMHTQ